MKWTLVVVIALSLTIIVSVPPAQAQTYAPAKGQPPEQQGKDTAECQGIAVQQSGFNPTQAQPAAAPAPQQGGERVRGAARGAAVGAAAGAIGGDAGKGAATGAAAGTVTGGMRKRDAARQQEAQAEQQQAAVAQGQAGHDKALGGCMQAEGHTVERARGAGSARGGNCLEARRNALVPRRADPRIAIFARREFVGPDAGANSLRSLEMIEAETIRQGEVPRRHRLIDRDGDDGARPLGREAPLSPVDDADPRSVAR